MIASKKKGAEPMNNAVWAMDVIDQYSDVKLPPDARRVLLNEPLPGAFGTTPFGRGPIGR